MVQSSPCSYCCRTLLSTAPGHFMTT
jgi:hypothetical protein